MAAGAVQMVDSGKQAIPNFMRESNRAIVGWGLIIGGWIIASAGFTCALGFYGVSNYGWRILLGINGIAIGLGLSALGANIWLNLQEQRERKRERIRKHKHA